MINNLTKNLAIGSLVALTLFSCKKDDDNVEENNGPTPTPTALKVYSTNNANGSVSVIDFSDMNNPSTKLLASSSTMADGAYYDKDEDRIVFASRSSNRLEAYSGSNSLLDGATLSLGFSSSADMVSPREVAVNGNLYVVADNSDVDANPATLDGRFFVYEKSGSTFTLRNTITVDFAVWGITFKGDDLYAIVDKDNELAVFTNFTAMTSDANISASKRIVIEGITRTHGLTYDNSNDVMVLTDIGDAAATTNDGGFTIINGFSSKFNGVADGGTLTLSNQIRVDGTSSMMNNPVDVAYDHMTKSVIIAEAKNGNIMLFNNVTASGSMAPSYTYAFASASSVFSVRK